MYDRDMTEVSKKLDVCLEIAALSSVQLHTFKYDRDFSKHTMINMFENTTWPKIAPEARPRFRDTRQVRFGALRCN